jgi:hypothetical protein
MDQLHYNIIIMVGTVSSYSTLHVPLLLLEKLPTQAITYNRIQCRERFLVVALTAGTVVLHN